MRYRVLKTFPHGHHRYHKGDLLDLTAYPSDQELKHFEELGLIAKDEPQPAAKPAAAQPART
jgi:hypothetical protein